VDLPAGLSAAAIDAQVRAAQAQLAQPLLSLVRISLLGISPWLGRSWTGLQPQAAVAACIDLACAAIGP